MRLTKRRVHRNPAAGRDGRQFGDETALPDARRRRHSDDGPRARDRPVQHAGQRGQLPLAANKCRVAAADCPVLGHPQQPPSGHRKLGALDADQLRFIEDDRLIDQPRGGVAEHHSSRRRCRFHPLGKADLLTDGRVTRSARTDLACDHLARVEAHPKLQIDTVTSVDIESQLLRLFLEVKCGQARAKGMVLQGHRSSENRHDAVAGELVHRSAVALHDHTRALDQFCHDLAQPLGTHRRGDVHRMHDIGEQHGHLLVLRRGLRRADRGPAPVAEAGIVQRFGATHRARRRRHPTSLDRASIYRTARS